MLLSAPGRFASSPCIVQPFLLYSFVLSSFFLFISILFIFVHLNLSVLGCVRCLMGTTLLFNPSLRDDVHVGWCNYCVLASSHYMYKSISLVETCLLIHRFLCCNTCGRTHGGRLFLYLILHVVTSCIYQRVPWQKVKWLSFFWEIIISQQRPCIFR